MIHAETTTIVGIFPDRTMADKAAGELARAGILPDQLEMTTAPTPDTNVAAASVPPRVRSRGGAALGAVVGAAIGCILGVIAGTGLIGGVPPLFAGGALAGVVGALIGIVVVGVLGALLGGAFTGGSSSFYVRDLHPGQVTVKVHANGRAAEAIDVLRRNGADVMEAPAGAGQAR